MMTNTSPNPTMHPTATEKRVCADCGSPFTLTQPEIDYFLARGLQIPRRCAPCRRERRLAAAAELEHLPHGGPR